MFYMKSPLKLQPFALNIIVRMHPLSPMLETVLGALIVMETFMPLCIYNFWYFLSS